MSQKNESGFWKVVSMKKKYKEKITSEISKENWIAHYMSKLEGKERREDEYMYNLVNKIWNGDGLPNEWKCGIICPLYKKGKKTECENYRPITLMNTRYKLNTSIVREKLQKEIERWVTEKIEEQ